MGYKPRPYQKEDLGLLKTELKQADHILFGASTGYGKSIVIYNNVKKELKKGGRVIVVAPRRKLVKQLMQTLAEFSPSLIMGTDTEYDEHASVYVCSTATLHNKLKKHKKKYFGDIQRVLIDEVHINFGSTSMSLLTKYYWETAKWVGLSATPIDAGGYRLEGWDKTIYEHQAQDLIDIGWLSPVKVMVEDVPRGLDDVGMTAGDYNEGQLGEFMSEDARVNNVYAMWKKYAKKRKTMIFAVNIAHAEIIYADFIAHGVKVGISHSNLNESDEDVTLLDFKHGEIDVLINVTKLTAGYDEPSVDCLILARPTKSKRLYLQIVGRGLRLYKGKKNCLILDLAGNIAENGYPTMRHDYNKVRTPRNSEDALVFNDIVCPFCDYSTQPRNCRREVIETKKFITKRTYCPNCEKVIDEKVEETKEIERLKLVKDYTNINKVSDSDVGNFVTELCAHKGYKTAWTKYIAKDYNRNPKFQEGLKLLYNRHEAKLINKDTAVNNIRKLREELELS